MHLLLLLLLVTTEMNRWSEVKTPFWFQQEQKEYETFLPGCIRELFPGEGEETSQEAMDNILKESNFSALIKVSLTVNPNSGFVCSRGSTDNTHSISDLSTSSAHEIVHFVSFGIYIFFVTSYLIKRVDEEYC